MEAVAFADVVEEKVASTLDNNSGEVGAVSFADAPPDQRERIGRYPVHPAASEFPLMEGEEFDRLVEAIDRNGQLDPITLDRDELLDGRNRLRAVLALQSRGKAIEALTVQWQPRPGDSPTKFIADRNLPRRNLTPDQRVQIAARLLPMIEQETKAAQVASQIKRNEVRNPGGRNRTCTAKKADTKSLPPSERKACNKAKADRSTAGKLAKMAGTTPYAATRAIKIEQHASPEDKAAVKAGKKKAKDVMKGIAEKAPKKPGLRQSKPIDHPYVPRDDFERDILLGWIRLVEQKAGIAEKGRARALLREIFKKEEAEEKNSGNSTKGGAK